MKKQFVVIGLGRFGGSIVEEFSTLGVEVLAIDKDEDNINKISEYATHAVQANATDEATLNSLGIRNFDHAIVSMGDDIESSILTSLLLKEMGIKQVWVKATNKYHQKVLEKIGVDRIIQPERDMAKRVAHHVVSDKIFDYIELSNNHSIAELFASKKVSNKSLTDLDLRAKFGCTLIGIQRDGDIIISPAADEVIREGDLLIILGRNEDIHRFEDVGI
ncbi:potassium transporter Trk [Sutcliffiella horikoshii]|uniref:Potassium transporter Trk n=1 Tax=Sutcliffiella horikoshii TaxID=79883 RepID=A0A1Y0CKJ6_9BACI|nr:MULTISPECIES: TrkA family potassium uptake protein [Bacillaceae]ART75594.1 potassium transporter Trk [Sutcliffiella horikoshii]TYS60878.1 TrkA family potassium uptake protein [Sutcliffiella horikoshii]